jgi:Cu/Ag efflux protein CusF
MQRNAFAGTCIVASLFFASWSDSTEQAAKPNPQTSPPPAKAFYVGHSTGIVTKINRTIGSVELNHKDVPGIMPAMIMEFYVKDKRMLRGLKVGDKVTFTLEAKNEVITAIAKQ